MLEVWCGSRVTLLSRVRNMNQAAPVDVATEMKPAAEYEYGYQDNYANGIFGAWLAKPVKKDSQ